MAAPLPKQEVALTDSEMRVVRSLLTCSLESGEDRIRASGLPRSTYLYAKRRLYSSDLLEDRYVPLPTSVGAQGITVFLTHPPTSELEGTVQTLLGNPETVFLLSGTQVVFGLAFHGDLGASDRFVRSLRGGSAGDSLTVLKIDPKDPQVPVYFDFEGAWNHFAGIQGSSGYPRGLGSPMRGTGDGDRKAKATPPTVLRALLARPFETSILERIHLAGPDALPRSQRRLLQSGEVQWRVLLSLRTIPYNDGASISQLIFIRGSLQEGGSVESLLRELSEECGVYPFFVASEGSNVLLLSLGIGLDTVSQSGAGMRPRQSVFPVMRRHLDTIDVNRENLSLIHLWRSHRYDLLIKH